jgi:hypothetical protein
MSPPINVREALDASPSLRAAGIRGVDEFEARCLSSGANHEKALLPPALIAALARANVDKYRCANNRCATILEYLFNTNPRCTRDAILCDALRRACSSLPDQWPTPCAVSLVLRQAIRNGGDLDRGAATIRRAPTRTRLGVLYSPDTRYSIRVAFATFSVSAVLSLAAMYVTRNTRWTLGFRAATLDMCIPIFPILRLLASICAVSTASLAATVVSYATFIIWKQIHRWWYFPTAVAFIASNEAIALSIRGAAEWGLRRVVPSLDTSALIRVLKDPRDA